MSGDRVDDEPILLDSKLQAWANRGYVMPGYVVTVPGHPHKCVECLDNVKCYCSDPLARWTTCSNCLEKQQAVA